MRRPRIPNEPSRAASVTSRSAGRWFASFFSIAITAAMALASCGDSGDPAPGDGDAGLGYGMCRRDSDCTAPFKYCNPKGYCMQCLSDSDCSAGAPFCEVYGRFCVGCRTDADCAAERPACVNDWESSLPYCAPCRVGSRDHCAAGQWCKCNSWCIGGNARGGQCTEHHCASDPLGKDCTDCRDGASDPCFAAGGACEAQMTELDRCAKNVEPASQCDLKRVAHRRTCVPDACKSFVDAVETCLQSCDAANVLCR